MKINIYGTGENALKYILSHRDTLEIKRVISSENENKTTFLGFNCLPISEAYEMLKNEYTIVASSENAYWEIKNKLEKYNLKEFEHFEYYKTYGKNIALVYGNCHTLPIIQALERTPSFSNVYGFYPLPPIQDVKARGGWKQFDTAVYSKCCLFIHQCVWEKNVYGIEYASKSIIEKLNSKCRIIGIPNIYQMPTFLYPQVNFNNSVVHENYNYFPFRDKFIDENKDKMTVNELSEAILYDSKLFNKTDIKENYDLFRDKIICREQDWSIKISSFIELNLRNKYLFYDPNHPTNEIVKYIYGEILKLLNYKEMKLDWDTIIRLDSFELPIYLCVKETLGLQFDTNCILRKTGRKLNVGEMSVTEYVRQYINWYK